MSRHTFDHGDHTWHVGWDRQLATFFAQFEPHDPRPDSAQDPLTDICGDDRGEVASVADLRERLRAHGVDLPAHLGHELAADRVGSPGVTGAKFEAAARRLAAAAFPASATQATVTSREPRSRVTRPSPPSPQQLDR